MVKCPKCGKEVNEGKFCESCGAPLGASTQQNDVNSNVCSNCGAPLTGGKFCEKCGAPVSNKSSNVTNTVSGIFDKIGSKVNKAASDMLAIKSDYSNNVLIYKVNKIPNLQDKTIKVLSDEYAYFSTGGGFEKKESTFTTNVNNFMCYFVKRNVAVPNSFSIAIDTKIKRIDDDIINLRINFDYVLDADVDKFFASMMDNTQKTWNVLDVNNLLFKNISESIKNKLSENIERDGNLDLSMYQEQIKGYSNDMEQLINAETNKYGLKTKSFSITNVSINVEEVNKILIKNLYK